MSRNLSYRKRWGQLIDTYGYLCFYCRKSIATTIDHVVPYSWDEDNSIENLVPACALCNSIAGDKIFESVEHKRQYVLNRKNRKGNRQVLCTNCFLPYGYRTMSPSLFLCAECYDKEYGTTHANKRGWKKWLCELADAGILPEAHRYALAQTGIPIAAHSRRQFVYKLIEYYDDNNLVYWVLAKGGHSGGR